MCKSNCLLVVYSDHKMEPNGKVKLICQFKETEIKITEKDCERQKLSMHRVRTGQKNL